ncbi:MAG TPA: SusC/RagA family TonB-linked outer membrane protein [Parafilimonas sp.]|nr:SusC/RagA family TonB-linked outer membrane protein [Parafilimonas sp.]
MTSNRLLKALMMCPILLLIAVAAQAQKKISGKILDERNNPIAGASIVPKNGTGGTVSDATGHFTLNAPANTTTVTISYVGYAAQDISVTSSEDVSVTLQPTNSNLSDIVVVGYGTARRKDLTGAVATVKEKDFNKGVITAPDQLIQGKAAGVLVINNTGQPGGSTTVRIRGTSSIRSGNQPLFVVDGIPLSGGLSRPGASGGDFGSDAGNPLNFINPNDIANMEILKDASATAIYGSRGANGVIIITTKRGQTGIPQLDISASVGASNYLKKLDVLNAGQFRQALKDYNLSSGDYGGNADAWDAITRTGITQNYNAAVSGGNENGRYRLSAGYLNQQGVIENSGFKKLSASLTSSFKFLESKKLGLDFNLMVTRTHEDIAPVSAFVGFTGNLIAQALQWNPTLPLKQGDSLTVYPVGNTTINPLAALEYYKDQADVTTVLASISPSYKITDDLVYKFLFSVQDQMGSRRGMVNRLLNLQGVQDRGAAFIGGEEQLNEQLTNTLNYNKQITSDLNINAVVGYEWLIYNSRSNFESGQDFDNIGLNYYDILQYSTSTSRSISSYVPPTSELQSFFGRAILNFRDKYLLTGTFRADGSTKFGENQKYGYFPSLGAAWNISNESFLRGTSFISNLKLRASWGKTGNQEFPSGASLDRYVISGNNNIPKTNEGNPDLKWETSTTSDVGIDFGILDNRLSGTVDYFYKKTTDVLFEQNVTLPGPPTKIWVNLPGYVLNKGWEVTLTGSIIRNPNVAWNLGVNASFLQNNVTGIPGYYETGELRGQGFSDVRGQRIVSGQPLNVWYLQVFEGIDKSTGQGIYKDNGAKFYVNSPNPKTILGINTDFNYKNLSVIVNMNGTFGQYIFNNTAATVTAIGNLNGGRNISANLLGNGESLSNSARPSTRYLEKGNYLKMSNATISYRVGNIGKVIRNLNISLTGQNLFIITNYSGFDPEVNTDAGFGGIPSIGVDYVPYPSARTLLLGVNFSL